MDLSLREVGFKLCLMSPQGKESDKKKKGQVFKKPSLAFLQMSGSHKLWFRDLIDKVRKPFTGT